MVIDTRQILKMATAMRIAVDAASSVVGFDLASGPDRTSYWTPPKKAVLPDQKKRAKVKAARKQRNRT